MNAVVDVTKSPSGGLNRATHTAPPSAFSDLFQRGMKRAIKPLVVPKASAVCIEVGGGPHYTRAAGWSAQQGLRHEANESVDVIHCYHFLEHLDGNAALAMLREFERVLRPGGVVNVCTPYYSSQMQAQDLDHRSAWCEESWRNIFNNPYYADKGQWRLRVGFCLIAGIVERNLALFTQLIRI